MVASQLPSSVPVEAALHRPLLVLSQCGELQRQFPDARLINITTSTGLRHTVSSAGISHFIESISYSLVAAAAHPRFPSAGFLNGSL
jgi:hypothetical protein